MPRPIPRASQPPRAVVEHRQQFGAHRHRHFGGSRRLWRLSAEDKDEEARVPHEAVTGKEGTVVVEVDHEDRGLELGIEQDLGLGQAGDGEDRTDRDHGIARADEDGLGALERMLELNLAAIGGVLPDRTFLLELAPSAVPSRIQRHYDRLEREGYTNIAEAVG